MKEGLRQVASRQQIHGSRLIEMHRIWFWMGENSASNDKKSSTGCVCVCEWRGDSVSTSTCFQMKQDDKFYRVPSGNFGKSMER